MGGKRVKKQSRLFVYFAHGVTLRLNKSMGVIFCSTFATRLSFYNKHINSISDRKNKAIAILHIMGTTEASRKF